jgi:hypothetical protein
MDKIVLTSNDNELVIIEGSKEITLSGDYKSIAKELIKTLGRDVEETPFEGALIIYEKE